MITSNIKLKILGKYGSQREFARIVGLYDQELSDKLNGKRGITDDEKVAWAKLLDLSAEEAWNFFVLKV